MERIVIFNDYANLHAAFEQFRARLDEQDLLAYLSDGRFLVEAHAFVPIDPRNPHGRDGAIEDLWQMGYLVHTKLGSIAGDGYRCNLDVEMTMEMMRTAELAKPDIIVLISGDKDFLPVVMELRRRGIRVEVAALPNVNAAREMMLKASGFIDLEAYQAGVWDQQESLESDSMLEAEPTPEDDDDEGNAANSNISIRDNSGFEAEPGSCHGMSIHQPTSTGD